MFLRIQKLTFSIYENTNVIQGLVNIGKPCVPFLNKTKHIMKSTSMWITRENFRFFKPLCTRGSLMTWFINLNKEKNLQYTFISNKLKSSTNDQGNILTNIALLNAYWTIMSYLYSISFVENYIIYRSRDTVIIKYFETFFTHNNRLMLHQRNEKNLSTEEAIVVSQDCPKFLRSPVTCDSKRVTTFTSSLFLELTD